MINLSMFSILLGPQGDDGDDLPRRVSSPQLRGDHHRPPPGLEREDLQVLHPTQEEPVGKV